MTVMQVRYAIRHSTRYEYADMVAIAHNEARLAPRDTPYQQSHGTRFELEPSRGFIVGDIDYFGNPVSLVVCDSAHHVFALTAYSEVTVSLPTHPPPEQTVPWEQAAAHQLDPASTMDFEALQFVDESPHVTWGGAVLEYARASFAPGRPLLEAAIDLMERIHRDFTYEPGVTSIATPVEAVMKARRGVCQDFAHVQLACLRSLGLSARYVSGYLLTRPPPGQKKLVGADASHAWVAVYCPGHGFVDLDPTNATVVGLDHTTLAWGRDFADVSPLKGVVLGGGPHRVDVAVDVNPASGSPATPSAG